nr:Chain C, EPO MIMETICS PEPTIDE 1 [synthetic construct]1EBP_D Chain D, EPO MIMETICS PEPTIDE 1 [synthetic construct]
GGTYSCHFGPLTWVCKPQGG